MYGTHYKKIIADPLDAALQLNFAATLDRDGNPLFAKYVRLHAELQLATPHSISYWKISARRSSYLKTDPTLWHWDQISSLSQIPNLRLNFLDDRNWAENSTYHFNRQATESQVADVEDHLGIKLPIPYRQLLTQFANGFSLENNAGLGGFGFFGTEQLLARTYDVDETFPLDWEQINEDPDHFLDLKSDDGLLCIGQAPQRNDLTYIVPTGPLAGLIIEHGDEWGCSNRDATCRAVGTNGLLPPIDSVNTILHLLTLFEDTKSLPTYSPREQ